MEFELADILPFIVGLPKSEVVEMRKKPYVLSCRVDEKTFERFNQLCERLRARKQWVIEPMLKALVALSENLDREALKKKSQENEGDDEDGKV